MAWLIESDALNTRFKAPNSFQDGYGPVQMDIFLNEVAETVIQPDSRNARVHGYLTGNEEEGAFCMNSMEEKDVPASLRSAMPERQSPSSRLSDASMAFTIIVLVLGFFGGILYAGF